MKRGDSIPEFFETVFPSGEGRCVLEFEEDVEVLLDEAGEAFEDVLVDACKKGLIKNDLICDAETMGGSCG